MPGDQSLDALRSLLAQVQSDGAQWYWLLDQSALPQRGWLRRHVGRAQWVDLLSGNAETAFNGATPVLVRASGTTACAATPGSFVGALYRVGRFANAVSLLSSALSIDDLQAALCERSRIDLPGNLEAVLRYFDTRTLPLLPQPLEQVLALRAGLADTSAGAGNGPLKASTDELLLQLEAAWGLDSPPAIESAPVPPSIPPLWATRALIQSGGGHGPMKPRQPVGRAVR